MADFEMRAHHVTNGEVYWVSPYTPDFTGALSGLTPGDLSDIVVVDVTESSGSYPDLSSLFASDGTTDGERRILSTDAGVTTIGVWRWSAQLDAWVPDGLLDWGAGGASLVAALVATEQTVGTFSVAYSASGVAITGTGNGYAQLHFLAFSKTLTWAELQGVTVSFDMVDHTEPTGTIIRDKGAGMSGTDGIFFRHYKKSATAAYDLEARFTAANIYKASIGTTPPTHISATLEKRGTGVEIQALSDISGTKLSTTQTQADCEMQDADTLTRIFVAKVNTDSGTGTNAATFPRMWIHIREAIV